MDFFRQYVTTGRLEPPLHCTCILQSMLTKPQSNTILEKLQYRFDICGKEIFYLSILLVANKDNYLSPGNHQEQYLYNVIVICHKVTSEHLVGCRQKETTLFMRRPHTFYICRRPPSRSFKINSYPKNIYVLSELIFIKSIVKNDKTTYSY